MAKVSRRLTLTAMVAVAGLVAVPGLAEGLNLAQRRAVEAYKAGNLPGYVAKIAAVVGKEVPVEVDWEAIAKPDLADRYLEPEFWSDIYFEPLVVGLGAVARDDMGKSALSAALTGIRVTWDPATAPASAYADGVTFEGGLLTLNFEPFSNTGDVAPRAEAIQRLMESRL